MTAPVKYDLLLKRAARISAERVPVAADCPEGAAVCGADTIVPVV